MVLPDAAYFIQRVGLVRPVRRPANSNPLAVLRQPLDTSDRLIVLVTSATPHFEFTPS